MMKGKILLQDKMETVSFYKKMLTRILFKFLIFSVLYDLFPWFTGVIGCQPAIITKFFVYAGSTPSQSFGDSLHNVLMIPFNFTGTCTHMW
jgi:hypothetical protein